MLKLIYTSNNFNFMIMGNTETRRISVVRTKATNNELGSFLRIVLSIADGLDLKADRVLEKLEERLVEKMEDGYLLKTFEENGLSKLFEEKEEIKKALETFEE